VYLVNGPPDGDGDIVLDAAVKDGHKVSVSLGEHDSVFGGAEPAGEAELFAAGNAVVANGRPYDSARGAMLGAKLREGGPDVMWSIGFWKSPDKLMSREPSPLELRQWPDARRIIEKWHPIEISPVKYGSCGPACRTLAAKCACVSKQPDPAAVKEALALAERRQAWIECCKEKHGALAWDVAECHYRWETDGRVQDGPVVKWFDDDGRRAGFYQPGQADVIWLNRSLSAKEVLEVAAHEAAHAWKCWDPSEESARISAKYTVRRYRQMLEPLKDEE
jgi:hypothetical protein